ncbi:MAG: flavodoxin family protein [Spirochaetaceae bacterium]|jgi:multimeric flavodoxin WrbA|nr:flavodoxin family protein [Spirochaetaceae bacterium]
MKNILVITGSPRKNGNSTLMANAFIEGAKMAGNETMLFEAGKMKINGCIACDTCFTKGMACSFNDDFNKLVPMLENADIIVFCTPLYWFTFPAQLKSVIDKLYSFNRGKKELKIRESILMVCAETNDINDFKGIIKTYKLILNYKGWKNREILTIPNVNKIGEIQETDALKKANNIGLEII